MKESKTVKNFPRRSVVEEMTPVEKLIFDTIGEIEKLGADVRLTNAQIKLQEAKDLIGDFEDSK